jgi:hypothetical protein
MQQCNPLAHSSDWLEIINEGCSSILLAIFLFVRSLVFTNLFLLFLVGVL